MQRVTLVTLMLLTIGLGAFVYFYEIRGEPRRKTEEEARDRLFQIDEGAVTRIDLTNSYGTLKFEKREGTWEVTGPKTVKADAPAVEEIVFTCNALRQDQNLGSAQDLDAFGLSPPAIELTLRGEDKTFRLRVGDNTPFGGKSYVQVDDKPDVLLVTTPLRGKLNRPFDDWRDKSIVAFTPSKVNRIAIEHRAGSRYEVVRDGASWRLATPPRHRLDASHFNGLLYDLEGLRAVAFTDSTDAAAYGLEPPEWRVTVEESTKDESVSHTVLFGREDPETRRVPVITSPGEEIRLVRASVMDRLDKPIDQLREKRVVPLERFVVGKLRVTLDGETLEADKTGDTWSLSGSLEGKAGPDDVESILNDLVDLEADTLIDGVPREAWQRFGLDTPFLTAVMSETDPEGKATRTATLHLGQTMVEGNAHVYARVEGDPTIYQVNRFVADDLRALLLPGPTSTPGPAKRAAGGRD